MACEQPIPFRAKRLLFRLKGVLLSGQRGVQTGRALGRLALCLGQGHMNGVVHFWPCNPVDKLFEW